MSTRPAYWANEPRAGVESGMLVAVGSLAVAIPTYLFIACLCSLRRTIRRRGVHRKRPWRCTAAALLTGRVHESSPGSSPRRRRSILYVNAHRSGPRCRFIPSCGEYAVLAVERFGLRRGLRLLGGRLRRCSPDYVGDYLDFPC